MRGFGPADYGPHRFAIRPRLHAGFVERQQAGRPGWADDGPAGIHPAQPLLTLLPRGLAAHMLFSNACDFGARDPSKPGVQAGLWARYLLDNAARYPKPSP